MHRFEKTVTLIREREEMYLRETKSQSFSSTLLDKIYRSIDEGEQRHTERFYRDTAAATNHARCSDRVVCEAFFRNRQWSSDDVSRLLDAKRSELGRETRRDTHSTHQDQHDFDSDPQFFSSTSISSSDSSSGGFSFSDTDSIKGAIKAAKAKSSPLPSSCFAPFRLKPVRTSIVSSDPKTEHSQFREREAEGVTPPKSRASKIYASLKKVKQPISPGGRVISFLSSIFNTTTTTTTPKRTKKSSACYVSAHHEESSHYTEKKFKPFQAASSSTCSSASSLSRSCLSKHSPSTRERIRNGVKRTVRFYPVSVIVGEDSRPCGHKSLYRQDKEREDIDDTVSLSVPTAWRVGRSQQSKKMEQDLILRDLLKEKSRRFEQENPGKSQKGDVEEDDGGASCSSSDLFELDHLAMIDADMNWSRYSAELPVYETTDFVKNRVVSNGYRL